MSLIIGLLEYCEGWTEISKIPLQDWNERKQWLLENLGENNLYAGPWAFRYIDGIIDLWIKDEKHATLFLLRWA